MFPPAAAEPWNDLAVVGRIARPHGRRGQVVVNPETDYPVQRFRAGNRLYVLGDDGVRTLTISEVRFQQGRPIVGFEGVASITEARGLGQAELRVPSDSLERLPAGTFYRHNLIGCTVVTREGAEIGVVAEVEGPREGSRLVVRRGTREILVPLAREICPRIDPAGRRIVIDPPAGLLDVNG